jgi:rhamnogalacturonan endolyase
MGSLFRFLGLTALLGYAAAAPTIEKVKKSKSDGFLTQIDNSTWIIGNKLWNVTQGRQYATKLMYKGKDRVGRAVGHYVSYSR